MAIINFSHTKQVGEKLVTFGIFSHTVNRVIALIDKERARTINIQTKVCDNPSGYTKARLSQDRITEVTEDNFRRDPLRKIQSKQELEELWNRIYDVETLIVTKNGITISVYSDLCPNHDNPKILISGSCPENMKSELEKINTTYRIIFG